MDETENDNEETNARKKSGSGRASGSGSGGAIRLPPTQLKEVTSNWEYLDATKVASRLAEFFSELPAKASAHVQVSWANLQNQGFAIVTQILKFGQEVSRLMHNLTRENVERLRHEFGVQVNGPTMG